MRGIDLKIGNILGIDFFMTGRNKPVRALARTGVSGDHRANVPEAPRRAAPFDKALDRAWVVLFQPTALSDMITIFQVRHSGMDCRNPDSMDGFELTIHGTGYPLPGGYDEFEYNLTK